MTGRTRRMRQALERLGPVIVELSQFPFRQPDLLPGLYPTELAATYAELARHLPRLIERFLDGGAEGVRPNGCASAQSGLRDRRR